PLLPFETEHRMILARREGNLPRRPSRNAIASYLSAADGRLQAERPRQPPDISAKSLALPGKTWARVPSAVAVDGAVRVHQALQQLPSLLRTSVEILARDVLVVQDPGRPKCGLKPKAASSDRCSPVRWPSNPNIAT